MKIYIPAGRSSYYVRFKFRGEKIHQSLHTANRKEATKTAQALWDSARERYAPGYKDGKQTTIQQIVAVYLLGSLKPSTTARQSSVSQLLAIACPEIFEKMDRDIAAEVKTLVASGIREDVARTAANKKFRPRARASALAESAERLTDSAILEYQDKQRAAGRSAYSINSSVRQAKAVLSKRAKQALHASGVALPQTHIAFLGASMLPIETEDIGYDPIDRDALKRMDAAVGALKSKSRPIWTIVSLARRLGMRNIEILHARKSWIVREGGHNLINLQNRVDEVTGKVFRVKNGYAGKIIVDDELFDSFKHLEPTDFLVSPKALHWTRQSLIYRRANDWLRPFIQDRPGKKLLYELRKEAGSIVAMEQGLEAARQFLRHKSITTTLRWYHAVLEPSRGVSIPPSLPE